MTNFNHKEVCELPSPKGEDFVLRLKPVRVGLTADFRDPLLPSGKGQGMRESISTSPTRALIESILPSPCALSRRERENSLPVA